MREQIPYFTRLLNVHSSILNRLLSTLLLLSLQRLPPRLIPLSQDAQSVLTLNVRHLRPIGDSRKGAVLIDDERAHVIELDCAASCAHVDGRGAGVLRGFG
jgi:hypothetical protein